MPPQIGSMIVLGLIVGAIAKFLMPGDDPGGIIVTIILGVVALCFLPPSLLEGNHREPSANG